MVYNTCIGALPGKLQGAKFKSVSFLASGGERMDSALRGSGDMVPVGSATTAVLFCCTVAMATSFVCLLLLLAGSKLAKINAKSEKS